jgi:sodium-independent sulfate anion transporter 11
VTSVQNLIDVRNQLDRYTQPEVVEWHFVAINNRWTKRALAAAGFGYPAKNNEALSRWKPIFSVADIGGEFSAAAHAEKEFRKSVADATDVEATPDVRDVQHERNQRLALVHGINLPLFHVDIISALSAAIQHIQHRTAVAPAQTVTGRGV